MKKHEVVTDMTFGQLYDAVVSGEEFYDSLEGEIYENRFYSLESETFIHEELAVQLKTGQITRLVEVPWSDQLDGTWENGVWCMCQVDEKSHKTVDKITWNASSMYPYESISTRYFKAEPLPQDLADQLEALSKEAQE